MRKTIGAFLLSSVICLTAMFGVACGGDSGVINDGKTVNVKVTSAGYGTTFVTALADKFNAIYANSEEGYKINVLPAQENLSNTILLQDIYSDSGVDVYWSSVPVQLGLEGSYGECLADITESVYNQPAIKFDGTNESKTIKEKVEESSFDLNANSTYNGKYYGVPTTIGTMGFAVNTKVINDYGLEIPKTTNEMWNCVDVIMKKAKTTRIFPFTYSTSGNSYPNTPMQYWFAQYVGVDGWNTFWSMQNEDGSNMEKPYEVFKMEGIEECFANFYRMYDYNIGADGSTMQDFNAAQGQVVQGDAAFMSTGSWMYNEECVRWADYIDDVCFVKVPVISELGYKLFGGEGGYDDAKCDLILSAICDGVDANKEVSVIKSEVEKQLNVTLKEEDVQRVAEARGIAIDRSGSCWYLNNKSDPEIKKIAALFLRMCASEEGAALMAKHTNETQFFAPGALANEDEQWFTSQAATLTNKYVTLLAASNTGYRLKLNTGDSMFPGISFYMINSVLQNPTTRYDDSSLKAVKDISIFVEPAKKAASTTYEFAKEQFEKKLWMVD